MSFSLYPFPIVVKDKGLKRKAFSFQQVTVIRQESCGILKKQSDLCNPSHTNIQSSNVSEFGKHIVAMKKKQINKTAQVGKHSSSPNSSS